MNNIKIERKFEKSKKILYPGCLVSYTFPEYEISSKIILNTLNIQTCLLEKAACCGNFLQGESEDWFYITAYNLALAEAKQMDIITLCGGCTNVFLRFQHQCRQDPELIERVNERLYPLGLEFHNTVEVCHILKYLDQQIDTIAENIHSKIPLKVAMVNPCQVFRPKEIMNFDNLNDPQMMRRLCRLAGSEIISYSQENQCCGSSVSLADIELGNRIASKRLVELEENQVDVMITACGNCQLLLDRLQKGYYDGKPIPGLFLPQLLGLAMGISAEALKIKSPQVRRLLQNV